LSFFLPRNGFDSIPGREVTMCTLCATIDSGIESDCSKRSPERSRLEKICERSYSESDSDSDGDDGNLGKFLRYSSDAGSKPPLILDHIKLHYEKWHYGKSAKIAYTS
jgi:hypothetical protein